MNSIEYVVQNRKNTFEKMPFNEVDALIFAELSYYTFSGDKFNKKVKLGELNLDDVKKATSTRNLSNLDPILLNSVTHSDRFKEVEIIEQVSIFSDEVDTQFSCTLFKLEKGKYIVAYRGTDGTCVGWKEDMNMTYMFPIPGQNYAAKYLEGLLKDSKIDKVIITGHSKGGNLAAFAACSVDEKHQGKIDKIYNFDGPGFPIDFYKDPGYLNVSDKLIKYVPPQSCVGRLLSSPDKYVIIRSDEKGLMQHWYHSWQIEKDHFDYVGEFEEFSKNMEQTAQDLLYLYTPEERKYTIDLLFNMLKDSNCMYVDDAYTKKDQIIECLKSYGKLSLKQEAQLIGFFMRVLLCSSKNYVLNLGTNIKDTVLEFIQDVVKNGFKTVVKSKLTTVKNYIQEYRVKFEKNNTKEEKIKKLDYKVDIDKDKKDM